jgi:hypothetical protein
MLSLNMTSHNDINLIEGLQCLDMKKDAERRSSIQFMMTCSFSGFQAQVDSQLHLLTTNGDRKVKNICNLQYSGHFCVFDGDW